MVGEPGARIAFGREADVYDVGPGRVLRRYRNGDPAEAEAAVMTHLAAAGFPVPRVYDASGPDLVMERLDGPTLLATALAGQMAFDEIAGILVDLHARLDALPAPGGGRILHLDLHPDNVILTARGPVVIDWRNAAEGPGDRDVAMTALILAQASLWDDPTISPAARAGLDAFQVRLPHPPASAALAWVVAMRRANPTMSAKELAQLDEAAALVLTR